MADPDRAEPPVPGDPPQWGRDDIEGLVAHMTLEEKASLCSGSDFWFTSGLDHLAIPPVMLTDGPHGLRKQAGPTDHVGLHASVPATCFPTAAALASSWDLDLLCRVGAALGREARANDVAVLLGPGINIKRSPLCGRNFEYFSEDPYLTGELAVAFVDGVQSQGVGTSAKHFAANNQEHERMRLDVQVDERTLREIYLRAFERVVTGAQPWTVMCSYNKVNGTYASQDPWLLTQVLREEWGFAGLVVSDWGAVVDRPAGLAAGLDLEMPASAGFNDARIVAAVRSGALDEARVDKAITRLLVLLARTAPARAGGPITINQDAHHDLAREAAARSAVLLKNDDATLPLDPADAADIVVLGELARTPRFQGAGSSQVNPTRVESILDAFAARGLEVAFAPGYRLAEAAVRGGPQEREERHDIDLTAEAADLAAGRTAVVVIGLPSLDESEGYDRDHLALPPAHLRLVAEVAATAERTIVLLQNGAVVKVADWADEADAILELWLGGQAGGAGAVDLLFGDRDPAGRLAETIPMRLADIPAQLNFPGENAVVRYGEGLFVGYRGMDAMQMPVAYPFGHGLTYTTFGFSDLAVVAEPVTVDTADDAVVVRVEVTITNTGDRAGDAVPQLYVGRSGSSISRAPRELAGFARVRLAPAAQRRVTFGLTRRQLSHWDTGSGGWRVEPGTLVVSIGASSRDLPLSATVSLAAPAIVRPLRPESTIGEWIAHPRGGPALIEAAGDYGALMFGPDADPTMRAIIDAMPLYKIGQMGMTPGFGATEIDGLIDRYARDAT